MTYLSNYGADTEKIFAQMQQQETNAWNAWEAEDDDEDIGE